MEYQLTIKDLPLILVQVDKDLKDSWISSWDSNASTNLMMHQMLYPTEGNWNVSTNVLPYDRRQLKHTIIFCF